MATAWVLGKVSDALQPTIQGAVGSAGSMAGGAVNAVGSSINGVGDGINRSIKYYGDGAKDYGNAIMDWTKAPGVRGQTAANPLGLSSTAAGGKTSVTSPSVYRAPPTSTSTASKKLTTTAKTVAPQKKIAEAAKKTTTTAIVKKPVAPKAPASKIGSINQTDTAKKTISAASKPKATPVKASTATVTKPKIANPKVSAANPLGLSEKMK